MSEASEGYEKLSGQFEILSSKIDLINKKLELYKQSGEIYKQVGDEKIDFIRAEIKADQDANKQQLNVSLGVLVTAAVAIVVSAVISR